MARLASLVLIAALVAGCGGFAGGGKITFGSQLDMTTLELVGSQKTTFRATDNFAWRAALSEEAGATSLRLVIAKVSGAVEQIVDDEALSISNPQFTVVGNSVPMSQLTPLFDGPGTYVMRVSRSTTTLAEGQFTYTQ